MASAKITVTIPEEQLEAVRDLVDHGHAASVSGFVQHALSVALDDVAGWRHTLAEVLDASGGPLTDDERRWADEILGGGDRPAA